MNLSAYTIDQGGSTVAYDKTKLFILSVVALVAAGMVFSIRTATLSNLQATFFDPVDPLHAAALVGSVAGAAFLGFALSIFVGSPLCDYLGMGRLLALASVLHIVGTIVTITAQPSASVYYLLWSSMFTVGLAHGLVEAVINPLIATIYADDKTHKLNVLHAWWPGGLIIGGLIGTTGLDWRVKMGMVLIPAVIYGGMLLGTKFPPTERIASGVSGSEMFREVLKPLFIVLFCCMFLTAASELAPGQWVDLALSRTVGMKGILLLVYVSALMFVMRHFAGSLAHRLSPIGLMWFSCLFAAIGLYFLSVASSPVTGILSATVWGIGVCYMWPTMLGITSERFPKGGAFLMGLMGCAGNISIYFVLPKLGQIFDTTKVAAAQAAGTTFEVLQKATDEASKAKLNEILASASAVSFRAVAILPTILIFVFGAWWLYDRSRGGYKAVKLGPVPQDQAVVSETAKDPAVSTQ